MMGCAVNGSVKRLACGVLRLDMDRSNGMAVRRIPSSLRPVLGPRTSSKIKTSPALRL